MVRQATRRRYSYIGAERDHRVIAERALGHALPGRHPIHHHSDTQLVICESQAYHLLLEKRTRVLRAGGNPNTDSWCSFCRSPRPIVDFVIRRSGRGAGGTNNICRTCARRYAKDWYARKQSAVA